MGTDEIFVSASHILRVQDSRTEIILGSSTDNYGRLPHQVDELASILVGNKATVPNKVTASTYAKSAIISGIITLAVERRGELDIPLAPKLINGKGTETQCPYYTRIINDELKVKSSIREDQ